MKCLKCHVELGEKTPKFCPSCGTPTSLACNGCGAKIPEGARFCPECGSPAMRQQPKRLSAVGPGNAPAHLPEANSESIAVSASNSMSARFARFWAKGVSGPFSCWKFSNTSQEEAQNLADERVAQIAEKYKKAKILPKKYLYSDQRLREPVIKETHNSVISQNAYGCLVLNTADVMFIDIDFPEEKSAGLLKSFFKSPAKDVQAETLAHIASWTSQNPAWGWRIYRTFAGLRLLATNGVFTPDTPEVDAVFEALGADPLYRVLCRVQKCFRARLTPKPWRCDMEAPNARWPWASEQEAMKFQKWQRLYDQNAQNFATCQLVATMGNPSIHPSVQPIIELHDQLSRVDTDFPLA